MISRFITSSMLNSVTLLILLKSLIVVLGVNDGTTIYWPVNGECPTKYPFDVTHLTCHAMPCSDSNHEQLSATGLSCTCISTYIQAENTNANGVDDKNPSLTCTACPVNTTAYNAQCVPCSNFDTPTTTNETTNSISRYDALTKRCTCDNPLPTEQSTGKALRTRKLVPIYDLYENGTTSILRQECHTCPMGTAAMSAETIEAMLLMSSSSTSQDQNVVDPYTCLVCPDGMYYDTDYTCQCPSNTVRIATSTVSSSSSSANANDVTSVSCLPQSLLPTIPSTNPALEASYLSSASICEYGNIHSERTALGCQALANLCVMEWYKDSTAACGEYTMLTSSSTSTTRRDLLPSLYLQDNDINSISTDDTPLDPVVLLRYAPNGTIEVLRGIHHIWTCATGYEYASYDSSSTLLNVQHLEYTCTMHTNQVEKDVYVYEAYWYTGEICSSTDVTTLNDYECWHRIPIHLSPSPSSYSSSSNADGATAVTRFVLHHTSPGISSSTRAVRYLQYTELQLVYSARSRTMVPHLYLTYQDTPTSSPATKEYVAVSCRYDVSIHYTTASSTQVYRIVLFSITGAICALFCFLQCRAVYMHSFSIDHDVINNNSDINSSNSGILPYLFQCILLASRIFVYSFTLLLFAVGTYFLLLTLLTSYPDYQTNTGTTTTATVLLWELYARIQQLQVYNTEDGILLYVCLILHTVYVLYKVHLQCTAVQVYLLPWHNTTSTNTTTDGTLLLGREWCSMGIHRKTNLPLTLGLILLYTHLNPAPDQALHSTLLQCTRNAWYFILSAVLQFIIQSVASCLYLPTGSNNNMGVVQRDAQRLVDGCVLCRTTMFVYVQGCGVAYVLAPFPSGTAAHHNRLGHSHTMGGHPYSGGSSSVQEEVLVWELYHTSEFRRKLQNLHHIVSGHNHDARNGVDEESCNAQMNLNHRRIQQFLIRFLASSTQADNQHQQRVRHAFPVLYSKATLTYLEYLFPSTTTTSKKNMLYPDIPTWYQDYSFTSVTFHGMEYALLLHDILVYNVMDVLVWNKDGGQQHKILVMLVTYFVHAFRVYWRRYGSRSTFIQSSGVDERLLWE